MPLRIETRPIEQLVAAPYNPRAISDDAMEGLTESLRRFGLVQPIVVNEQTGHIVGGHQRVKALERLGESEAQVVVGSWSEQEEKQLNLTLNNPHASGHWTDELAELLADIDDEALGALQLDALSGPTRPAETATDDLPDDVEHRTEQGELWGLGDHRLFVGPLEQGLPRLFGDDRRYRLLVTDPPYGVDYAEKNKMLNEVAPGNRIQTPIESDERHGIAERWRSWFSAIRNVGAPGACYFIFHASKAELTLELLGALRDSKLEPRHQLIWVKNNHVLGRSDYNYRHEPIAYGWLDGAAHTFTGASMTTSTVWEIPKPVQSKLHPTQKPVELYRRAILDTTHEGDIICDPFCGSGTCIVAAEELSRRALCCELTTEYADTILTRWEQMTGAEAARLAR